MKVAELADVPVVLVADIDRGGVFASIIGTLELLEPVERKRVAGVIINKFRGDITLFEDGVRWLEEKTGIPVLGVLPYIDHHMIDGEDSLSIANQFSNQKRGDIDVVVVQLPFISNYSDLEPFLFEEDVSIRWVKHVDEFGAPDAVIIPGTKSTIHDLKFIKEQGLDVKIKNHFKNGGFTVGICGGYQILGDEIFDEAGSDTGIVNSTLQGIGLIPGKTIFYKEKETIRTVAEYHKDTGFPEKLPLEGYEIHLGKTVIKQKGCSFLKLEDGKEEGYFHYNGQLIGTYLHHLFHNDEWRNRWLNLIRKRKGLAVKEIRNLRDYKDQRYTALAVEMKAHLKWDLLKEIIENWSSGE
jgi:adenosylcobyric acid synthase